MDKMIISSKYIKPLQNTSEWKALSAYENRTKDSEQNKEILNSNGQFFDQGFMWFAKEESSDAKQNISVRGEKKGDSSVQVKRSSKPNEVPRKRRKHDPRIKLIANILLKSAQENLKRIEHTLSIWTNDTLSEHIEKGVFSSDEDCERNYPKRNIEKKCYKEEDLSSEDEYLYCDDCERDYKGACPEHGPMLLVCDNKAPKNAKQRALQTLPNFLSIGRSCMPKAGLGVWTEVPLPKGMVFGPYQGEITKDRKKVQDSGYAWKIRESTKTGHFVEAAAKNVSNWLRFVNCADREERQNLMAFQYKKQIYYKTYKPVLPYTELLVWYGNNFASDLGIEVKETKQKPIEIEGYRCDECPSLFSSKKVLATHKRHHPYMTRNKVHKCPHCSYSTFKTTDLQHHMSAHMEERKVYKCFVCPMIFQRDIYLQRHLQKHTGEKSFLCKICKKVFPLRNALTRHARIHSGERPYRCSTCGKDFKQSGHVKRHERAHIAQKPYRCLKCDYRAIRSSELNIHVVQVHTKNFKHICPHCGRGFIRQAVLKSHCINKHLNTEIRVKQENTEANQNPAKSHENPPTAKQNGKTKNAIKKEPHTIKKEPLDSPSSAKQTPKQRFQRVTPLEYIRRRLRAHMKYTYSTLYDKFYHMECIEKSLKSKFLHM